MTFNFAKMICMRGEMADNKCGDCAFLITEEGEPYYCATRDLYTLRDASDKACGEFVSKGVEHDD